VYVDFCCFGCCVVDFGSSSWNTNTTLSVCLEVCRGVIVVIISISRLQWLCFYAHLCPSHQPCLDLAVWEALQNLFSASIQRFEIWRYWIWERFSGMRRIVSGFSFSFIFEYVCASCVSEEGGKADKEERRLSFEMQEIAFFLRINVSPCDRNALVVLWLWFRRSNLSPMPIYLASILWRNLWLGPWVSLRSHIALWWTKNLTRSTWTGLRYTAKAAPNHPHTCE
jgi:hypothetical protein